MKNITIKFLIASAILTLGSIAVSAQANNANAENLDLYAVAELFRDSGSIEKFEQALNDPSKGVNNLDLNNDGAIDFIRVIEQTKDDTRLVVLQTPTGENEFQDVATIAVERENNNYNLHILGDEEIYGANYYVVPAQRNFSAWNVVKWLFSPNYRAYVSPYRRSYYPTYYVVRRPLATNVYRTNVGVFAGRRNFVTARTTTVRTVNKIAYRPARSNTVVGRKKVTTTTKTVTNQRNGNQKTKQTTTVVRRKRN